MNLNVTLYVKSCIKAPVSLTRLWICGLAIDAGLDKLV